MPRRWTTPGSRRSSGAPRSSTRAASTRSLGKKSKTGPDIVAVPMPNVTFHAAAETEYQEAYAWYHSRSQLAADRFEEAVARTLDEIAAAPERGIPFGRKHRCR